ncbi:hypothetical protein ACE6H2_015378 [Prunus campanulata]
MGMDKLSEDDKLTVASVRKIQRFLSQPFHVAEVFIGALGKYVKLKESITSFQVSLPPLSLSVLFACFLISDIEVLFIIFPITGGIPLLKKLLIRVLGAGHLPCILNLLYFPVFQNACRHTDKRASYCEFCRSQH